jgi:hypothetical protein
MQATRPAVSPDASSSALSSHVLLVKKSKTAGNSSRPSSRPWARGHSTAEQAPSLRSPAHDRSSGSLHSSLVFHTPMDQGASASAASPRASPHASPPPPHAVRERAMAHGAHRHDVERAAAGGTARAAPDLVSSSSSSFSAAGSKTKDVRRSLIIISPHLLLLRPCLQAAACACACACRQSLSARAETLNGCPA